MRMTQFKRELSLRKKLEELRIDKHRVIDIISFDYRIKELSPLSIYKMDMYYIEDQEYIELNNLTCKPFPTMAGYNRNN
jgi:hypothetical protein